MSIRSPMNPPAANFPTFLDQSLSLLIAGWKEVNLIPFRLFRALRGRKVYPKNVNETSLNVPRTARGTVVRDRPWPPGTAYVAGHGPVQPTPVHAAGLATIGTHRPLLFHTDASTKQRPFPHRRLCCPSGSIGTTAASDSLPARRPLPGSTPVIGRAAPAALRSRSGRGGPPQFPPSPSERSAPSYAGESFAAALQALHRFHGLHPEAAGSALPRPTKAGTLTTRQASLHATDR